MSSIDIQFGCATALILIGICGFVNPCQSRARLSFTMLISVIACLAGLSVLSTLLIPTGITYLFLSGICYTKRCRRDEQREWAKRNGVEGEAYSFSGAEKERQEQIFAAYSENEIYEEVF